MKAESKHSWLLGTLAAVAASLCCVTPVLALLGGIGGIASTFSWIEAYRPYLIGATVLVFGFAWYQKLKPKNKQAVDCACDDEDKPSFFKSKKFLALASLFAALMISFPHYAHIFYPKSTVDREMTTGKEMVRQVELKISGMTCQGCAEHVNHALDGVPGVLEHITSYEHGTSLVKFDTGRATQETLVEAVNATGYKVTGIGPVK